jgi:hypothetical protein
MTTESHSHPTIWIIEYGCSDLHDSFCAAFTTRDKAIAHAKACAAEHAADDPEEQYEITEVDFKEAGSPVVQVNLRNTSYEFPNDWWVIHEVPLQ